MTQIITRRGLLTGMFAAPAIIAIDRLMPVKLWKPNPPDSIIMIPLSDHLWTYEYVFDSENCSLVYVHKFRFENGTRFVSEEVPPWKAPKMFSA